MPRSDATAQMTRAGLNLIQQALTIYDRDLRLAVCNRPFQTMFGLPEWLVTPGAPFEDTIRFLVETGEYGEVEDPEGFVATRVEQARAFVPHYMERRRANGRTISVEGSPLPEGGWVTVYTDITAIKSQEALLRARSEELSDQLLTRAEELARTNRQLESTIAQLEEAKRGLAEMEARTRLVTEMTPAHIGHVDTDGIYTFTNRRLSSVLPGRSNDIVGLPFRKGARPRDGAAAASQPRPCAARRVERAGIQRCRVGAPHPHRLHPRPGGHGRADQRGLPAVDRRHRGGTGARGADPDPQARTGRAADQRAGA